MSYPQIIKDRLASGVGIVGITPNLVDDTGASNLPDGSKTTFKFSSKVKSGLQVIKSTNNGVTWSLLTPTTHYSINYVTNAVTFVTAPASTDLFIVANSSAVLPYIQTTPKPVIEVLPKVKASNSHSIYKGALVGNQVAGKVQVGNGVNGYESKVLDNALLRYDYVLTKDTAKIRMDSIHINSLIYVPDASLSTRKADFPTSGYVYKFVALGDVQDALLENFAYGYPPRSESLGPISSPVHVTIALDNANSPASKWFECLEEGSNGVLAGVYGQEVVYGADTGNFANLSNGTTTDFSNNTVRTFHGAIPLNGKIK